MDNQNKDNFRGYISYMDILAFTSKIKSDVFKDKYKKLTNHIGEKFSSDPKVTIYVVSDSIIVVSKNFREVKEYAKMIYTWGMNNDVWIRGAITQGEVVNVDTNNIIKENKNVIFPYLGEAYIKAYDLEYRLNMAGIVIDRGVVSDHPDLPLQEDEDYIEYQEYLPKEGNENKKRLLLPLSNYEYRIADTMYFEEMLKSHLDDIDKYINTFCFYIMLFLKKADIARMNSFLEELIKQLGLHGRRILIPSKVIIIFIAVIDALLKKCKSCNGYEVGQYLKPSQLEFHISTIIGGMKKQGYLSVFTDYLLEYDKKNHTTLYKDIYELRANITSP